MADTMRDRTGNSQYRPARAVRQDSCLGRYVAQGGSRTEAGAHAKELRTWGAARQFIACYCTARALRAIESLRACIAGVVRPVTPVRVLQADAADQAENTAQTAWLLDPTPSTTETYIRALNAEAAESLDLARDLAATRYPDDATVSRLAAQYLDAQRRAAL